MSLYFFKSLLVQLGAITCEVCSTCEVEQTLNRLLHCSSQPQRCAPPRFRCERHQLISKDVEWKSAFHSALQPVWTSAEQIYYIHTPPAIYSTYKSTLLYKGLLLQLMAELINFLCDGRNLKKNLHLIFIHKHTHSHNNGWLLPCSPIFG